MDPVLDKWYRANIPDYRIVCKLTTAPLLLWRAYQHRLSFETALTICELHNIELEHCPELDRPARAWASRLIEIRNENVSLGLLCHELTHILTNNWRHNEKFVLDFQRIVSQHLPQ